MSSSSPFPSSEETSSLTNEDIRNDALFPYESLPPDYQAPKGLSEEGETFPEGVSDEMAGRERDEDDGGGGEGDVEVFL